MIEYLLKIFFLVNNEIVRCENYKFCLCMIYTLFNSFKKKCEFYIFIMVIAGPLISSYHITITIAFSHPLIIYIINFSLHNKLAS